MDKDTMNGLIRTYLEADLRGLDETKAIYNDSPVGMTYKLSDDVYAGNEKHTVTFNGGSPDTRRLNALMQDPSKLWVDTSGPEPRYSGDGETWRNDPRQSVDDLISWRARDERKGPPRRVTRKGIEL